MSRVAVVGSGATGYVALQTLSEVAGDLPVDVFHGGPAPHVHRLVGVPQAQWTRDDFAALHAEIRATVGRAAFPPPKSHFGETVPKHAAPNGRTVWRSAAPGGLTRYWSASLLPFTARELGRCGFAADEFQPHYRWVAERVGLAARADGLDLYFGESFATRPPMTITPLAERLIDAVETRALGGVDVVAGVNRLALETRAGQPRACVACGGCFYGCPSQSVFDAAEAAPPVRRAPLRNVHAKVLRARRLASGNGYELETDRGVHGPYERVFCAAGCVGSAEIVARSFLGSGESLTFVDNELFVLPLVYLGRGVESRPGHVAIANALLGFLPDIEGAPYAELHVAPIPDLLTRLYFPGAAQRAAVALARGLRGRALLAKLYLHSDTAPVLRVTAGAGGGEPRIELERAASGARTRLPALRARLRRALEGSGFLLPRGFPALRSKTSSHYAGALGPGSAHAADVRSGEVAPGFHVLDSAVLPFSPAQPLTFTSMANAHRIVEQVI